MRDDAAVGVPLVGKKYMNQLGGMANEAAAASMSSFARKQMEKMGWTEGKGLGKSEQGMATFVRVKKREDAMGIGVEAVNAEQHQTQWWYNVYDNLADKIKIDADSEDERAAKKRKHKKSKEKAKKKDKANKRRRSDSRSSEDDASASADTAKDAKEKKFRIPTDEELFAATGGKLFGRRAYGSCTGKLKRDALLVSGKKTPSSSASTSSKSSADSKDEESAAADDKDTRSKKGSKHKKSKKTHRSKQTEGQA